MLNESLSILFQTGKDKDKNDIDESSLLLAIAVFVASAPPSVSMVPSLQAQCIELFQQSLKSDEASVCRQ